MNPTTKKILIGIVLVAVGVIIGVFAAMAQEKAQDFDQLMEDRKSVV